MIRALISLGSRVITTGMNLLGFCLGGGHVLADWHSHHSGGSSGSPPTPEADAMAITLLCLTIGGVALSALNLFGGGLLIFWTRRKRDAFWLIPLVNLLLYSGAVMWRPHPLGFGAQFWGWQLLVLSLEISVIVLMSLIWTTLLVLIRWGVEALRRQEKGSKTVTSAPDAAASTGIGS